MAGTDSFTVEIADKIAAYEGTAPGDLDPPLYEVINTDALEVLFKPADRGSPSTRATLEFIYNGYTIKVNNSGTVDVLPREYLLGEV